MTELDNISFPLIHLEPGRSWITGHVVADNEGHPVATFGEGDEAARLATWFMDAANSYRIREQQCDCPYSPTGGHQYDDDRPFEPAEMRPATSQSNTGDPCVWCEHEKAAGA